MNLLLLFIQDDVKGKKSSSDDVPTGFNPLPASRSVVGQHRGKQYK